MEKIPTVFDRDWDGDRAVVPKLLYPIPSLAIPTEKLDGMNVRVTVRGATVVRIEARKNPTKVQKRNGIEEPWYRDAYHQDDLPEAPGDRYLVDAVHNTSLDAVPDGEWAGEAVGPRIQGNPLALERRRVYFFDRRRLPLPACVPTLESVPTPGSAPEGFFEALYDYLAHSVSSVNPYVAVEGIVWHTPTGEFIAKLKTADFKRAPVRS